MLNKFLSFFSEDKDKNKGSGKIIKTTLDDFSIYENDPFLELHLLLEDIIREIYEINRSLYGAIKLSASPSLSKIKSMKDEEKLQILGVIMERRKHLQKYYDFIKGSYSYNDQHIIRERGIQTLKTLFSYIVKSLKDPDIKAIQFILDLYKHNKKLFLTGFPDFDFPYLPTITHLEAQIEKQGLTDELKSFLKNLITEKDDYGIDRSKVNNRINDILHGRSSFELVQDSLGIKVKSFLQEGEYKIAKEEMIGFLAETSASSPSGVWIKRAKALAENVGRSEVIQAFTGWLDFMCREAEECFQQKGRRGLIDDKNSNFLRGVIWLSGLLNEESLNQFLDKLSLLCFKKIPNVGAVSVKIGNSCIYALSLPEGGEGIASLTKLRMKVKYPSVQKYIEKVIAQLAISKGKTSDEIEEMAVPDFGLDKNYQVRKLIGDYTLCIKLLDISKTEMVWINSEGKEQKSIPEKIKGEFSKEIKEAKKLAKDITDILAAQKDRIEQIYFKPRSWKYAVWKEYYSNHPLVSILSRNLIWYFKNNEKGEEGICFNGKIINHEYKELDWIIDETEVKLWHPIGFDPAKVLKWREWMVENHIQQPFKQAYREIYILTDAEINTSTYSNRFASHILRQHQFAALCKSRGWHYALQGAWDSHNTPFKELPQWKLRAEFWVDSNIDEVNDSGIFNYVTTDQVRFYNDQGQLELLDVPALIFSEIMRDVDLFVGVTSIGNNPAWQDSGNQQLDNYFYNYSIGDLSESAKTRKEVLQRIIQKLKISPQCTFSEKHLVVKGNLRTYKIHLGSGNIFMEPNDQYLCIVKDSKASDDKIFLPFEGDHLLSIILSKAILLADDKKIKDPTILRQIG